MADKHLVIEIYSKTNGKNVKHASTTEVSNILEASYIAVQTYEQMLNGQFQAILEVTSLLQTKQFALLPSHSFLCLLLSPPTMHGDNSIVLGSQDYIVFSALRAGCTSLSMSMKEFGKRKPKAEGAVVDDDDV